MLCPCLSMTVLSALSDKFPTLRVLLLSNDDIRLFSIGAAKILHTEHEQATSRSTASTNCYGKR